MAKFFIYFVMFIPLTLYVISDSNFRQTSSSLQNSKKIEIPLPPNAGLLACDTYNRHCTAIGCVIIDDPNSMDWPSEVIGYWTDDAGKTWNKSYVQVYIYNWSKPMYGLSCSADGLICAFGGGLDGLHGMYYGLSYYSRDGGKNWGVSHQMPSNPVTGRYKVTKITCDVTGMLCFAQGTGFEGDAGWLTWTSLDGGMTWNYITWGNYHVN